MLVGLLAVALVLRLAAAAWWQTRLPADQPFYFGDSTTYWAAAQSIARGGPYEAGGADAHMARMPGYPLLLAGPVALGGGSALWTARVLGAVLGTLAVGGVYWTGRQLFDTRAAAAGAMIAAVQPELVVSSAWILSEAPFSAAMMLQLALAVKTWKAMRPTEIGGGAPLPSGGWKPASGLGLAVGLAGGLATLIRPSWLLFTPLLAGCLLLSVTWNGKGRPRPTGVALCVAGCMVLGLAAMMAPWWMRCARLTGRFVPATLQVGASLYDGWHPGATGASDMSFVPGETAAARAAYDQLPAARRVPFEYFLDRWLLGKAIGWAWANPGEALRLAGVKFARMWKIWPNAEDFQGIPARLVLAAGYVPLVLLAAVGLWRFAARGGAYWLMALPAVYLTGLHMIFVGSIRYREPALLALAVPAGALLARKAGPFCRKGSG